MASIKDLKKDIGDLTYEVVSDCFSYMLINKDKNKDKVMKIVADAIKTRNELIYKVGHYKGKDSKKARKDYYDGIREELFNSMDKKLEQLSKLAS